MQVLNPNRRPPGYSVVGWWFQRRKYLDLCLSSGGQDWQYFVLYTVKNMGNIRNMCLTLNAVSSMMRMQVTSST